MRSVDAGFPLDPPQWSLFAEYVASFLFARIAPWLTLRRLIAVVICALGALMAIVAKNGTLSWGFRFDEPHYAIGRVLFPFFTGVLIRRLETTGSLPPFHIPWLVLALLLGGVLLAPGKAPIIWLELLTAMLIWPIIIVAGRADGRGGRWRKPLLWLGAISYPLYVLHVPLLHPFAHYGLKFPTPIRVGLWIGQLAGVIVFSQLALRFFDEPIRSITAARHRGARRLA